MKSSASGIKAFALVLVTAMSLSAAIQDTIALGKGSNQPIEIKSTKLTAKSSPAGVELTFDGGVELKQDDMMLSCDKMVVLYEEEKKSKTESGNSGKQHQKNIANSIKSAVGSGNVRIVKNELTAVAGKALFDSRKRTVTLVEGEPRVSQGPHSISAPTITMYLDDNRAELSGAVRGQLHPAGHKSGSNQPIDITSNKLTAKAIAGGTKLTFDGKVKLEQGDMTLGCDRMVVSYEEEKKAKADQENAGKANHKDLANSIKSAEGTGNVSITRNEFKATAGKAVFDNAKRTVTLTEGPPRVKQGPHELSGPMITVYLDQKKAELSQGVKGRLQPAPAKSATTVENHSGTFLTQSSDQPIDITSNKLVAEGISGGARLNFDGKVKLEQGDVTLSCDKMAVLYEDGRKAAAETEGRGADSENQGKGKDISNSIKSVVALGNVKIANTKLTATAGKGVFDSSKRTVTLTEGPPKLRQGPHTLTAPTITISLDENRAELLGEDKNGLKGILNPEKQEKEK